jgi:hypothetical protein
VPSALESTKSSDEVEPGSVAALLEDGAGNERRDRGAAVLDEVAELDRVGLVR